MTCFFLIHFHYLKKSNRYWKLINISFSKQKLVVGTKKKKSLSDSDNEEKESSDDEKNLQNEDSSKGDNTETQTKEPTVELPEKSQELNNNNISPIKSQSKKTTNFKNIFKIRIADGRKQQKSMFLDDDDGKSLQDTTKTEELPRSQESPSRTEEGKPIEWSVGDCLWGKVTGHPWWPCMVSYELNSGIYTKMQGKYYSE